MHKKIQEHSIGIITIVFVAIVLIGVIVYIIVQSTSSNRSRSGAPVFANDERMAILSQKSNVPDINPKLTVADRLRIMSQPAKTINIPLVPKIKK